MSEIKQFDCFTRLLVFKKLFVLVEYSPNQDLWHARIENVRSSLVPKNLTRSSYAALANSILVFEQIEQEGTL